MTDEDLTQFAGDFREGLLGGRSSSRMCAAICLPLATLLNMHGVGCEPVETDLGDVNHIWLRLADGRALDPTLDQFAAELPPVYLGPRLAYHGAGHGN